MNDSVVCVWLWCIFLNVPVSVWLLSFMWWQKSRCVCVQEDNWHRFWVSVMEDFSCNDSSLCCYLASDWSPHFFQDSIRLFKLWWEKKHRSTSIYVNVNNALPDVYTLFRTFFDVWVCVREIYVQTLMFLNSQRGFEKPGASFRKLCSGCAQKPNVTVIKSNLW